jgi:hypothetical protein
MMRPKTTIADSVPYNVSELPGAWCLARLQGRCANGPTVRSAIPATDEVWVSVCAFSTEKGSDE